MDWNEVGRILATLAPTLAGAIGTPAAGGAVLAIEKALGVDPGSFADPVDLAAAVQAATPEQCAALQRADNEFKVAQMANELETVKSYLSDVQSARGRDLALAQAGRK